MNEKLTSIANNYSIELDQLPSILDELNIENPHNIDPKQIKQFETVCCLLHEDKDFNDAISLGLAVADDQPISQSQSLKIEADTITIDDDEVEQSQDQGLKKKTTNQQPKSTQSQSLALQADTITVDDEDAGNSSQGNVVKSTNSTKVESSSSQSNSTKQKTTTIDLSKVKFSSDDLIEELELDLNGLVPTEVLNKHLDYFSQQITRAILQDLASVTQAERKRIATHILDKVRQNLVNIVKSKEFRQQFQAAITKNVMPKDVIGNQEYEFHVARQLVIQQLIVFVQENERAIKVREDTKRLKEEEIEQKLKSRRVMHQEISFWLGSGISITLIVVIGLFLGLIFGVNVPDGAACSQGNFLCHWFRFRQPKVEFELD